MEFTSLREEAWAAPERERAPISVVSETSLALRWVTLETPSFQSACRNASVVELLRTMQQASRPKKPRKGEFLHDLRKFTRSGDGS